MDNSGSVILGCGCEVYGDEAEELKQRFRLLRLLIISTALSMPLLWDLPPHFQFVLATALHSARDSTLSETRFVA